jgi:hypothetical protein
MSSEMKHINDIRRTALAKLDGNFNATALPI